MNRSETSGLKPAAYFDMDGTLTSGRTLKLYVRWMRRVGLLRRTDPLRLLWYVLLYQTGLLPSDHAYRWLAKRMAGLREEELYRQGRDWFRDALAGLVYPGARDLIRWHVDHGHLVAILTASSRYVTLPLAESLGIEADDVICTRFGTKDGLLDGTLVPPPCFGEGKVHWARIHAQERGVDLSRSYFYSDSINDLPMLLEVGYPKVVNPDRLLARQARLRGWEVLHLGG